MAFVNTRDTIGDQATVDGLVEQSLAELKEDGIFILPAYSLYNNLGINSVILPNAYDIGASAFQKCSNLLSADIGENASKIINLKSVSFAGCNKLHTIKIGTNADVAININSQSFMSGTNALNTFIVGKKGSSKDVSFYSAFDSPRIKHLVINPSVVAKCYSANIGTIMFRGDGAVYVPSELINSYKEAAYWKNVPYILPLESYPQDLFDNISDSWTTILSNASYNTDYSIQDSKVLELTDGTKIKMELAALDTDEKSDGSGKAKMTWICHASPFTHEMNSSGSGYSWLTSTMRSYLINDILSKIPTEIKSHIVSVKKNTYNITATMLETDDQIWLLSAREIKMTGQSYIETDGPIYSDYFSGSYRKNMLNTSSYSYEQWYLRTSSSYSSSKYVQTNGNLAENNTSKYLVVFGFCTD